MRAMIGSTSFLWTARGLVIAFTLFVSMFALDVFKAGHPLGAIVIELIIHLAPSFLLLFVLWITWTRARYAALGYLLIAGAFTIFFQTYRSMATLLLFTAPLLLTSLLFSLAAKKVSPPASA
ncbi:MAG: hypothetical protein MUF82_06235 [Bacteroidetes bacterium]|nr:hypothetical protein [Bacteroidota bacterium]